ncbi:MAG: TlpA family protein disulfide reductase [Nitrospira sp.]|nr:TlpA family protein disulfide reductase [Nitrospira sp.]MBS0167517.1 TlpA family protein disulfide reductase [Nitrospira sp.]
MIARMIILLVWGLVHFEPRSAEADSMQMYAAAGMKAVSDERPAPSFRLTSLDGTPVDSMQLRGKVLLVNFWATWCGPCKEEMPALERLKSIFANKEFELLAVTTDQQREGIRKYVATLGLHFPVLIDERKEVSAAFGVRGLPTTVLIDKQGRMAALVVGPRQWDGPESVTLIQALMDAQR